MRPIAHVQRDTGWAHDLLWLGFVRKGVAWEWAFRLPVR